MCVKEIERKRERWPMGGQSVRERKNIIDNSAKFINLFQIRPSAFLQIRSAIFSKYFGLIFQVFWMILTKLNALIVIIYDNLL